MFSFPYRNLSRSSLATAFVLATLVLPALFAFAAGQALGAEIRFRSSATVGDTVVRLGDVADVTSASAAEAASLRAVTLFPAPTDARLVYAEEALETLALRGVAVGDVTIAGSRVVVVRPGATGSATTANSTMTSTADGPLSFRNDIRANASGAIAGASFESAEQATPAARKQPPAPVVEAPRAVALRDLPRGAIVGPGDVAAEPPSAISALEGIVGAELEMSVRAGSTIDSRRVRAPLMVHRGEPVEAIVAAGSVTVRTRGIADSDGALGDRIVVRSADRKRSFDGVVVARQTVQVGGAVR